MKCNRCGSQMREKIVITGKNKHGDPVYSRYAYCNQCRVKKKLADNVKPPVPAQKPPNKVKKRDSADDIPAVQYRKKSKKNKGSATVLNSLILLLGILNLILIIFIVIVLNKHNFSAMDGLKSVLPSKTSSYSAPVIEEQSPDLSEYGISSKELSDLLI